MATTPEPRINTNLRVWVTGTDPRGNSFKQTAIVENISRHGARIRELRCLDGPGDLIRIANGSREAAFRVVWINAFSGRVGVCSIDDTCLWLRYLPNRRHSSSESTAPPTQTAAGVGQRQPEAAKRTEYAAGLNCPQEDSRKSCVPSCGSTTRLERRFPRYRCSAGVTATTVGRSKKVWAQVTVVSAGGCYVQTGSPFPPQTKLKLLIGAYGENILLEGVVRYMHAREGMGVLFTDMEPARSQELRRFIATASRQDVCNPLL